MRIEINAERRGEIPAKNFKADKAGGKENEKVYCIISS